MVKPPYIDSDTDASTGVIFVMQCNLQLTVSIMPIPPPFDFTLQNKFPLVV